MLYCIALIKLKTLQLKIWKYCRGHSSVLIAEWSGTEAAGQGENAEALMQLWCRLKKRNSWAVWLPSLYYCNVCTTATLMLKKTSLILRIITKPAWKACGCESCWTKVCFAAREWFDFWRHPVAARPGPAAHVFLVVNILVSKNSGYLLNKYFKYALRQCPKSFNTTIQMWTAAPPPPPSCRPESQHQAKIIK